MCLQHCREKKANLQPLKRAVIGGAAMPQSMIGELAHFGVSALHAWGKLPVLGWMMKMSH